MSRTNWLLQIFYDCLVVNVEKDELTDAKLSALSLFINKYYAFDDNKRLPFIHYIYTNNYNRLPFSL